LRCIISERALLFLLTVFSVNAGPVFALLEAEAKGCKLDELVVPEEFRESLLEHYHALVTEKKAVLVEATRQRKDGSLLPVEINATPIQNENGHVVAISVMFRDISERKRARFKQEELTAELGRRPEQWQAIAGELKEEAERRALVERELSQVLRSTVEDQEAERKRIARELHDSLGQTLTLLKFGLDEFGHALPDNDTTRNGLAALKGLANDVGSQVNWLAWEIRPTALDDLGLETSIRQLVEAWSERLNMRFILRLAIKEQRLSPMVETTLYRVLQEAITNIARHANATRVAVLLEAREKEVSMIVEDNGRGFSPNESVASDTPSKHLGLLGIRERLSLVSGTLEVESTPGKGCTLYIRVPL